MTCIIAIRDGNCVVMGSDSACIEGDNITTGISKTWILELHNTEYLIGFAGNFAEGDYIRYGFKWPKQNYNQSLNSWLVKDVQPALQKSLKERFDDRKDIPIEWILLFCAKPGKLFVLSQCGHVEESNSNFIAIGSGRETANGCLETFERLNSSLVSWEKIDEALLITAKFHTSVRGPNHLKVLV